MIREPSSQLPRQVLAYLNLCFSILSVTAIAFFFNLNLKNLRLFLGMMVLLDLSHSILMVYQLYADPNFVIYYALFALWITTLMMAFVIAIFQYYVQISKGDVAQVNPFIMFMVCFIPVLVVVLPEFGFCLNGSDTCISVKWYTNISSLLLLTFLLICVWALHSASAKRFKQKNKRGWYLYQFSVMTAIIFSLLTIPSISQTLAEMYFKLQWASKPRSEQFQQPHDFSNPAFWIPYILSAIKEMVSSLKGFLFCFILRYNRFKFMNSQARHTEPIASIYVESMGGSSLDDLIDNICPLNVNPSVPPPSPALILGINRIFKVFPVKMNAWNVGCLFGCLSVVLGAFGAHGLSGMLAKDPEGQRKLQNWHTGVSYQFMHSLAILAYSIKIQDKLGPSVYLFVLGILMFSGSLYAFAFVKTVWIRKILGPVTPIGGLCYIGGWLMMMN